MVDIIYLKNGATFELHKISGVQSMNIQLLRDKTNEPKN